MGGTLTISGQQIGRKRRELFEDFSVPFPPDLGDGGPLLLRDLITRIVLAEVAAFRRRQSRRQFVRALSAQQMEEGLEKGKIDSHGRRLTQKVDDAQAIETALQAFEDGLYLVIIDGAEQRSLDAEVFVRPGSRITFIRLTFLAGA